MAGILWLLGYVLVCMSQVGPKGSRRPSQATEFMGLLAGRYVVIKNIVSLFQLTRIPYLQSLMLTSGEQGGMADFGEPNTVVG